MPAYTARELRNQADLNKKTVEKYEHTIANYDAMLAEQRRALAALTANIEQMERFRENNERQRVAAQTAHEIMSQWADQAEQEESAER